MVAFGSRGLSATMSEEAHSTGEQGHIAFVLTYGFMARMVLRSGVARRLIEQGFRVTMISPNADELYFQKECEQEHVALCQAPQSTGRIADWFRTYRPYLLDDVMNNVTHRSAGTSGVDTLTNPADRAKVVQFLLSIDANSVPVP